MCFESVMCSVREGMHYMRHGMSHRKYVHVPTHTPYPETHTPPLTKKMCTLSEDVPSISPIIHHKTDTCTSSKTPILTLIPPLPLPPKIQPVNHKYSVHVQSCKHAQLRTNNPANIWAGHFDCNTITTPPGATRILFLFPLLLLFLLFSSLPSTAKVIASCRIHQGMNPCFGL